MVTGSEQRELRSLCGVNKEVARYKGCRYEMIVSQKPSFQIPHPYPSVRAPADSYRAGRVNRAGPNTTNFADYTEQYYRNRRLKFRFGSLAHMDAPPFLLAPPLSVAFQ